MPHRYKGNSRQSDRARKSREPPNFPETTPEAREAAQHAAEALADELNAKPGSTIAVAKVSWHMSHLLTRLSMHYAYRNKMTYCRHTKTYVAAMSGALTG